MKNLKTFNIQIFSKINGLILTLEKSDKNYEEKIPYMHTFRFIKVAKYLQNVAIMLFYLIIIIRLYISTYPSKTKQNKILRF